jgi:hypothetical protein
LGDPLEGREDVLHQVADQPATFLAHRRRFEGSGEAGRIPAAG